MKICHAASRAEKKQGRAKAVERIVVTVAGIPFDGNEVSQERLARKILTLDAGETTTWTGADNIPRPVTREELRQALRLAMEAQEQVWFL